MLRVGLALVASLYWLLASPLAAQRIASSSRAAPYAGVTLGRGTIRLADGCVAPYFHVQTALCTRGVRIAARAPATAPVTPASWGATSGARLVVNGDFFRDDGQGYFVYGDAVGGGTRWPAARTGNAYPSGWFHHDYGWIAFGPGWVQFSHTRYVKQHAAAFGASEGFSPTSFTEAIPAGTTALVSGFSELVIEGRRYTCPDPTGACFPDRSDMRARNPRSAMGLSADRRTFHLVTVDGRRGCGSAAGLTGEELAWLMSTLGVWEAINLDGGGSTALWQAGTGYLNQPSDGTPRPVMNFWGVLAGGTTAASSCCPAETCNGRDDDCDGAVDEGCARDAGPAPRDTGPAALLDAQVDLGVFDAQSASDAAPTSDAAAQDAETSGDVGPVPFADATTTDADRADARRAEDANAADASASLRGGCTCRIASTPTLPCALAPLMVALLFARRRLTRRGATPRR